MKNSEFFIITLLIIIGMLITFFIWNCAMYLDKNDLSFDLLNFKITRSIKQGGQDDQKRD